LLAVLAAAHLLARTSAAVAVLAVCGHRL